MALDGVPGLDFSVRICDPETGFPTPEFQQWFQTALEKAAEAAVAQAAAEAAQAAATSAQAAATSAQTSADAAQDSANSATALGALTGSGVVTCTITASDEGADASITISAHTRIYGDGSTLAIAGPTTLNGLAYSTTYFIYYDDPTRADVTPNYQTTTSEATAVQTGDRHLVGRVTTPAALDPDVDGYKVNPAGIGYLD